MKHSLFLVLLMMYVTKVSAQYSVSGSVNANSKPLPLATVSLLNGKDSTWLRSVFTNDKGQFGFDSLTSEQYLLEVQAAGYVNNYVQVDNTVSLKPVEISMLPVAKSLGEIVIRSKKSLIETGLGKTVLNVDKMITSSGSNVLDVLRKAPGLTITNDGNNIAMQGKQGLSVYIDGRPTYLSGEQLAQYLKAMSADEVAQLELITQPSAKYDAEGTAGIINIKTKRSNKRGFNGSASLTYAQTRYANGAASLQLNYRREKLGLFTSINAMAGDDFMEQYLTRNFRDVKTYAQTGTFEQNLYQKIERNSTDTKAGADYKLNNNTNVGVTVSGEYQPVQRVNSTDAGIYDEPTDVKTYNYSDNKTNTVRQNALVNTFFRHTFSKDNELSVNADYLKYGLTGKQYSENTNYNDEGAVLPNSLLLRSNFLSDIDIYSIKADHSFIAKGNLKIESGFKSSFIETDNTGNYEILQNNTWVYDTTRSNSFLYKENTNALYFNISSSLGDKWEAQAGLRAEQTNINGRQVVHQQTFVRNWLALFPTMFLVYKADSNNRFELNYGRRVNRPPYNALNPFIEFISQYNFLTGNPYLMPEYINNITLKHTYDNKLTTSFTYSNTSGVIEHILAQNDVTKIAYSKPYNFASNHSYTLSLMYNKKWTDWWDMSASGFGFYTRYNGSLTTTPLMVEGTGFAFNLNNQFSFSERWAAECILDYSGKTQESLMRSVRPWVFSAVGLSKKVLKDAGTIRVKVEDPFFVYKYNVDLVLNDVDTHGSIRYNTCIYGVSFVYNFGGKVDGIHKGESGIHDESKRANM